MNAQTPQKFTLEEIAERKKKLLNEIHAQNVFVLAPMCTAMRIQSARWLQKK